MTEQVLKALWGVFIVLLPSIGAAIVAFVTRARFIIVGLRHPRAQGNRYRFNIHYHDDIALASTVEVALRVAGGGHLIGQPTLLTGPGYDERGEKVEAPKPVEDGKRCVFKVDGIRARTTWVLLFDTDGRESNAWVEIVSPRHPPVCALASTSARKPGLERFLPSRLFLVTLAVSAVGYFLTLNVPNFEQFNVLNVVAKEIRKISTVSLEIRRKDPDKADIVLGHLKEKDADDKLTQVFCAVAGLIGLLLAYESCIRRGKMPVSHGYLGWHPGVPTPKDKGGKQ